MLLTRRQGLLLIDEFDAVLEGGDEFLLAAEHFVIIHVSFLSHYISILYVGVFSVD